MTNVIDDQINAVLKAKPWLKLVLSALSLLLGAMKARGYFFKRYVVMGG